MISDNLNKDIISVTSSIINNNFTTESQKLIKYIHQQITKIHQDPQTFFKNNISQEIAQPINSVRVKTEVCDQTVNRKAYPEEVLSNQKDSNSKMKKEKIKTNKKLNYVYENKTYHQTSHLLKETTIEEQLFKSNLIDEIKLPQINEKSEFMMFQYYSKENAIYKKQQYSSQTSKLECKLYAIKECYSQILKTLLSNEQRFNEFILNIASKYQEFLSDKNKFVEMERIEINNIDYPNHDMTDSVELNNENINENINENYSEKNNQNDQNKNQLKKEQITFPLVTNVDSIIFDENIVSAAHLADELRNEFFNERNV